MAIISPYTNWVRTFGCTHGLEKAGRIAHELGHKAAIGAWLSRDLSANEQEITNLIAAANAGEVDLAIVGSEVLRRGDLLEAKLIEYINRVRMAIPDTIPVTTADVYGELLAHPTILDTIDLVFANYYPYWQGVKLDNAIAQLHCWHQRVRFAAKGKPVFVSESGWPSCGNTVGEAVPSLNNASAYFLNFVSWARANEVSCFYFSAFDESWKAIEEGPQGACWGVWDKNGILKSGMQRVFDGETISDNWSFEEIPGGPGTPEIEFTFVPRYGSSDDLRGQIWHVKPVEYWVVVYIYVSSWWIKPYDNRPFTIIDCDGGWTADIVTGGFDQNATRIKAFLIPHGFKPPTVLGERELPSVLDSVAIAKVEVTRDPSAVQESSENVPASFELLQNHPNPFNPSTTIRFALPQPSLVTIKIYDILGREVRTLVDRKFEAGRFAEIWDGKDNRQLPVSSGVYLMRMQAGGFVKVKKLVLVR
jgi:exo-beta-1,3-glucanase (GH17 family)